MSSHNCSKINIHQAARSGYVDRLKMMVDNGEDVNSRNGDGYTAIMTTFLGVSTNKKVKGEILDFLLKSGADVNAVNKDGDTTLHVAVRASRNTGISKDFVRDLVDRGADKTTKNNDGRTASQLAYQVGNTKLGDVLLFYDPKPIREKTAKKAKKEKKAGGSGGLASDVLSCIFPSFAFHMRLREDINEVIRKGSRPETPSSRHDKEPALQPDDDQTINSRVPVNTEDEYEKLNDDNDSVSGKVLKDSESVNANVEANERYDKAIPLDLIQLEKTDILVKRYEIDNKTDDVLNAIIKQSNVHQLPHIGNEARLIRRCDRKIHTLPHIGNECNLREKIDDGINYVYN